MKRAHLTNAALLVASLIFSIGAAEIALRIVHPDGLVEGFLLPPNGHFSFSTDEFSTTVLTNGIGLREQREFSPRHDGIYRIAVIGDSVTFGWGVENDEAYPAVLDRILKRELGPAVEVINFGRPGENPVGYLRTFMLQAEPLHPDMVIVGFLPANDCPLIGGQRWKFGADADARQRSAARIREGDPSKQIRSYVGRLVTTRLTTPLMRRLRSGFSGDDGSVVSDPINGEPNPLNPAHIEERISKSPTWAARYEALEATGWVDRGRRWEVAPWLVVGAILYPNSAKDGLFLNPDTRDRMERSWARCENVLTATAETVRATGAELVLLVLPAAAQVSPEHHAARAELGIDIPPEALSDRTVNEKLDAFCRREGLLCIDALDATRRAARSGARLFYPIDGHPTAETHALLAKTLAPELTKHIRRILPRSLSRPTAARSGLRPPDAERGPPPSR